MNLNTCFKPEVPNLSWVAKPFFCMGSCDNLKPINTHVSHYSFVIWKTRPHNNRLHLHRRRSPSPRYASHYSSNTVVLKKVTKRPRAARGHTHTPPPLKKKSSKMILYKIAICSLTSSAQGRGLNDNPIVGFANGNTTPTIVNHVKINK